MSSIHPRFLNFSGGLTAEYNVDFSIFTLKTTNRNELKVPDVNKKITHSCEGYVKKWQLIAVIQPPGLFYFQ